MISEIPYFCYCKGLFPVESTIRRVDNIYLINILTYAHVGRQDGTSITSGGLVEPCLI
jgi:hypothetical protein